MSVDKIKKYWYVPVIIGYLGIGQFFEGLQPVFRYQMEAHAQNTNSQITQNRDNLREIACLQIVAGYIRAKQDNNAQMIAHWTNEASRYGCVLPRLS